MAGSGDPIGKYDLVSQGALDTWEEFIELAKNAHSELLEIVKLGPKINQDLSKVQWAENLSDSIKDVTDNLEKLIKVEKQLQLINDKLLGGEEARKAARKKEIEDRRLLKEAQKKETEEKRAAAAAAKAQERAEKIAAATAAKIAKEKIRNAQQVAREQDKANKASAKFYDELDQHAKKVHSATSKNTSLSTSFIGLTKNIGSAILAYSGINTLMNLVMNSFTSVIDVTKKLNTLDFSIKAIIANKQELGKTTNFLDEIIINYGLDLVDTTNAYIKFRAAVGSSNLEVKEGQEIFNSVAKATSVLGLSQEKTNLVFLALEQMLAKGIVSSEELRRQMGEQLPVAMTSMAKAYATVNKEADGSVASLLKFMKQGKVVSEEVLPEFARQIEKALGIETVTKVDTVVAAQERLNTQWAEFVDNLKAGGTLIKIYNNLAEIVGKIANAVESAQSKVGKRSSGLVGDAMDALEGVTDEEERRVILSEQLFQLQKKQLEMGELLEKEDKKRSGWLTVSLAKINRAMGLKGGFSAAANFEDVYEDTVLDAEAYSKAINEIKSNFDALIKYVPKEIIPGEDSEDGGDKFSNRLSIFKNQLDTRYAVYEEHLNAMRELSFKNAIDSGVDEMELDTIDKGLKMDMEQDLYEFKLELLNDLYEFVKRNGEDVTSVEKEQAELKADFAKKLTDFRINEEERFHKLFLKGEEDRLKAARDAAQDRLAAIETEMQERILILQSDSVESSKSAKYKYQFGLIDEKLAKDTIAVMIESYEKMLNVEDLTANEIENISKNLFNAKKSLYEAERDEISRTAQEAIDKQNAVRDFTAQSINDMFSMFSEFQNARMQQLEWDFQRETNLAGDNLDQKLAIENQYNKEKAKLERRQAVANKLTTSFNIILNTLQGVTSAMASVATIPLIPFIKAMGAISLAAALAVPLPKYRHGGEHPGGLAEFSEEGPELFIPITGDPIITPKDRTIANMPAGKFIPHDETMNILSIAAMDNLNKEVQELSLNETNSILRKIADKDEIIYDKGFKMTNKNNIFGRYVTRN